MVDDWLVIAGGQQTRQVELQARVFASWGHRGRATGETERLEDEPHLQIVFFFVFVPPTTIDAMRTGNRARSLLFIVLTIVSEGKRREEEKTR